MMDRKKTTSGKDCHHASLEQHVSEWLDSNSELVQICARIAHMVSNARLIKDERKLPFELQPQGNDFIIGAHLDHPICGHYWINVISEHEYSFVHPHDEISVSTLDEAQSHINELRQDLAPNYTSSEWIT